MAGEDSNVRGAFADEVQQNLLMLRVLVGMQQADRDNIDFCGDERVDLPAAFLQERGA